MKEFDNPIASDYQGSYGFTCDIEKIFLSQINMEVLRTYQFSCKDTGKDTLWKFDVRTEPPRKFVFSYTKVENITTISILFTDTLQKGSIIISGVRPNRQTIDYIRDFRVYNPYSLGWNNLSFRTDTLFLSKTDTAQILLRSIKDTGSVFNSSKNLRFLSIFANGQTVPIGKYTDTFKIGSDMKDSLLINGKLADSSENIFELQPIVIFFRGAAPAITSFIVKPETLSIGDAVTFTTSIAIGDMKDSIRFLLTKDNNTIFKSRFQPATNAILKFTSDSLIRDTSSKNNMILYVITNRGLTASKESSNKLTISLPPALINSTEKTIVIPASTDYRFYVPYIKNAKYSWSINDSGTSKSIDTTTDSNYILIRAFNDIVPRTLGVYAKIYNFTTSIYEITIQPRFFNYIVKADSTNIKIPVNKQTPLKVRVQKDGINFPDDSVAFFWSTSNPKMQLAVSTNKSECNVFTSEIIPACTVSVFGIVNSDTSSTYSFYLSTFDPKPVIRFDSTLIHTTYGTETVIKYIRESGSIDSIYYRQLAPSKDTIIRSSVNSLEIKTRFYVANTIPVQAWAIDKDKNISDIITMQVVVTSNKPSFQQPEKIDTAYVGDRYTIRAPVNPMIGDSVDTFYWNIKNDSLWDTTTTFDSLDIICDSSKIITVGCKARSGETEIQKMVLTLKVKKGTPVIDSVIIPNRTFYIRESIPVTVNATDPNDSITKVYLLKYTYTGNTEVAVIVDSATFTPGEKSIKRTLSAVFNDTAKTQLFVKIKDCDNDSIVSSLMTPVVLYGEPVIDSCIIRQQNNYINKRIPITLVAHDPNDTVRTLTIRNTLDDSTITIPVGSKTVRLDTALYFKKAGKCTLMITGTDIYSRISSVFRSAEFIIDAGVPVIDSVTPPILYTRLTQNVTIYARDNDFALLRYAMAPDSTFGFWQSGQPSFPFKISTPGTYYYNFSASDPDGQNAKIFRQAFVVLDGNPVISAFTIDSENVFVEDAHKYSIRVNSPVNRIRKVYINWTGDTTTAQDSLVNLASKDTTISFNYTFTKEQSGNKSIAIWAVDDSSWRTTAKRIVNVRKGAPVLISFKPDTVWANDDTLFKFSVTDTNGRVNKIIIDWADPTNKKDTITLNAKALPDTSKKHLFPVRNDTAYNVKITLIDDDGVMDSVVRRVVVKRGMPVINLPNPNQDTLFIPINPSGGDITVFFDATDPNGSCNRFYFDFNAPFTDTTNVNAKTDSPSFSPLNIQAASVNTGIQIAVYARDDDGNVTQRIFILYPDSRPPDPVLVYPKSTTPAFGEADTVTLTWTGMDTHDGLKTEYMIYLRHPGGIAETVLKPLAPGTSYIRETINNVVHFKFKFLPPAEQVGIYYWRVESKDFMQQHSTVGPESFYHQ
jgi:hypothetical protein